MAGRVIRQTIYGTQVKTVNIGARVNVVYLARFINLVERRFGTTVQSTSAAIRAVMESLVDDAARNELDPIDESLIEGDIVAAQQYLVGKGLMSPGSITQGDQTTARNVAEEYRKLELSGGGKSGIDFSMFSQLPNKEEGMRALAQADPVSVKRKADELYEYAMAESKGKDELDALNMPLTIYKGAEAERIERKIRSWARNPEFDGYDNLTKQEKVWFNDERARIVEEEL